MSDDILLASIDTGWLHETKRKLSKTFDMKVLSETSFVLGILPILYIISDP